MGSVPIGKAVLAMPMGFDPIGMNRQAVRSHNMDAMVISAQNDRLHDICGFLCVTWCMKCSLG
jgi:hypothetical protein